MWKKENDPTYSFPSLYLSDAEEVQTHTIFRCVVKPALSGVWKGGYAEELFSRHDVIKGNVKIACLSTHFVKSGESK